MPAIKMCCPICVKNAEITNDVTVHVVDGRVYRNKTVLHHSEPLNTSAAVYQELYLRCQDPKCTDHHGNPTRWVISVSFLRMISPPKVQDFIDNMERINGITPDKKLQRQLLELFDNGYVVESAVPVAVAGPEPDPEPSE